MSAESAVRRLRVEDAAALVALRREALESHPLAFSSSVEEDRGLSLDLVRSSLAAEGEQAVYGYFFQVEAQGEAHGEGLAGMVGVARVSRAKQRHKAAIWGMYVAPRARNRGAGRALLAAAIAHARGWPGVGQLHLAVTEDAPAARRLYEAAGFRAWGREPRALHWEGRFVDEHHLVLDLRPEGDRGS